MSGDGDVLTALQVLQGQELFMIPKNIESFIHVPNFLISNSYDLHFACISTLASIILHSRKMVDRVQLGEMQ